MADEYIESTEEYGDNDEGKKKHQELERDYTHPIHGGHPLSWPPIFNRWIPFPIPKRISAIFTGDLTLWVATGGLDVQFDRLTYNTRLNIWRAGFGKTEATSLTSVANTEPVDLSSLKEFANISLINIQLKSGKVMATMKYRGCLWPSDFRRPDYKPHKNEAALATSIQDYADLAGRYKGGKLDQWKKDAGMIDFYNEWDEIESSGRDVGRVDDFIRRWSQKGNCKFCKPLKK